MTQLEKAKNKLNRLKEEENELMKAIRKEHDSIPFGQPNIIGRRDIYKDVKRYRDKSIANMFEQDKQEKRIEMLEKVEKVKSENSNLKDVHVDYAFSMASHENRLYTCSLTQKLSAVEFTSG